MQIYDWPIYKLLSATVAIFIKPSKYLKKITFIDFLLDFLLNSCHKICIISRYYGKNYEQVYFVNIFLTNFNDTKIFQGIQN
mmetsp:Transcript_9075/g.4836  ORF Transcript_9075/g.4836 Transcript_9075/m.4836 type:complete len:82 (-) Transcript_9075:1-246(-)